MMRYSAGRRGFGEGQQYSDNPTFRKEFERIVEGARKAGLPER